MSKFTLRARIVFGVAAIAALLWRGGKVQAQTPPWEVQQDSDSVQINVQGEMHVIPDCANGYLAVNGAPLPNGQIACATIQTLTLQGDATDNWLDASALNPADFPALQRVTLNGGAGDDTLTASPFPDVLNGEAGRDVFVGTGSEDQTDAATGEDFFVEATLPLGNSPVAAVQPGGAPAPASPGTEADFGAIDFDTDASNSGYYHIPPDPHGAAGPNHVVNVVNTSIEWYTKDGTNQHSGQLEDFFASLAPVNDGFDPKVLYDQYEGRFVVVTLERQDDDDGNNNGDPDDTSRILLAVSDDSDPNGTWYYTAINSKITIGGTDTWADYPGFAVDDKAVYITANMFGFGSSGTYQGARLWIIDKGTASGFYAGGAASVNVVDPYASHPGNATTTQPSHTFGTPPTGMGVYLIAYSGWNDGTNEYVYVSPVTDPLGTPAFDWQFYNLGDIDDTGTAMPDAPQQGSGNTIETNDRRALNAVWRDDALWAAFTVRPGSGTDSGEATAHWVKLNASGGASTISLADQGNVGGEDIAAGTYTFFPSVMVDSCGNMAIGFAASGNNIYPGAYYAARFASDPAGTVQSSGTLHAGTDYYYRTFGSGRNRWGDYTAVALDPSNESTFWVYNEYAMARGTSFGGEDGRWTTQWGSFDLGCADTNVVLSEVMFNSYSANGTDETPYEWVEIYNKGDVPVDLSGWSICEEQATNCDALTGVIPAGEYWLIANNATDLATELANYGDTPDPAKTIYLNSAIGNNGLANSGDAVFLLNGGTYCGSGGDACTVDCISWDSTNTCAALIAAGTRSYLPNADGYDDTALTSNEQQGQSVVNIQGTWYQSGPATNQPNQASPYQPNVAEGGSPTALTLQTFRAHSAANGALASLALLALGGAALLRRRKAA